MMKKRIKTGGALILAAVLAISAFAMHRSYAAEGVEVDRKCSLTVNVANKGLSELVSSSVEIKLYKVADIAVTGAYTELTEFDGVGVESVSSETTTAQWEEMSAAAAAKVTETTPVAANASTENGVVKFNDLSTGMYLVYAQKMETDYYQYDFTPYLISLPDNRFYDTNDDTWLYDIEVSLKPSKADRVGDLKISKFVDVYNETLGEVTFVFQVEAEKVDIDSEDQVPKKVYSNVVALTFKEPGEQFVLVEDIPAGAVVTVTEVYSGASYKFVSSGIVNTAEEGKLVIIADEDARGIAEIKFDNTYDYGFNNGTGLVNIFTYDNEYTHSTNQESATPAE